MRGGLLGKKRHLQKKLSKQAIRDRGGGVSKERSPIKVQYECAKKGISQ